MCWLDKAANEQIFKLKELYGMSTMLETGTFRGAGARYHSFHWKEVLTCEIVDEYIDIATAYTKDRDNVTIVKESSDVFIKNFIEQYRKDGRDDYVFMFLDAHFYDPDLPPEDRWVVSKELKALEGFDKCVVYIHDFDCSGLGHCCYEGQPLGFPVILNDVMNINPNFNLYVNSPEWCDIHTEDTIKDVKELIMDDLTLDSVRFCNSSERLRRRGILYCTPTPLDLDNFKLRRA